MSKYTQGLEQRPRNYYRTWDTRAVKALAPFLNPDETFAEPCAGDGVLVRQIEALGLVCVWASDIEPDGPGIVKADAFRLKVKRADHIITNPPWDRALLHPMIRHFAAQAPTFLLFQSDWAFTKQAREFMPICSDIIAIGRLRWIENTKMDGKENCSWYRFDATHEGGTRFHPQT